jgi:predicted TIM-barrel fold metal-dependent hydrolase
MKTYYDIHCHIFNKDVLIRKLVNVVQSVLTVKDLLESHVTAEELKYKIDGIDRTLEEVTQDTSEQVYQALDKVYKGNVVTTPLMFDLSYADDNDDDEHHNKRYRKRIKRVFWLLSAVLIPIIRGKAKRKFKNDDLLKTIDKIKDNVKAFNKSFDKKSDDEVEIFDDANYDQQIIELEYLAGKYETIRPFFSVDPRREYKGKINTIKNLEAKLLGDNPKFAGVKLYTPAGFSPTDPVLMGTAKQKGVYKFCVENNIPITVHNSNAGFACLSTVLKVRGHVNLNNIVVRINKPIKFQHKFFSLKTSEAIHERATALNHPKLWALVLKKYPNLTINFAHFGGSNQIMEYANYAIDEAKIDVDIFEDALLHLSQKDKGLITTAYHRKRKKMLLRNDFTIAERAEIWNAMYRAELIDNWAKGIFDLIKNPKYPNAFTDLSCFSAGMLIHKPEDNQLTFSIKEELVTFKHSFFDKLSEYEKSKVLYGSDFFLAQFFGPTMEQYFADFKAAFGDEFDTIASDNPERFLNVTS